MRVALLTATLIASVASSAMAAQSDEELAKKLANPIANLISVPFQFNYDSGYGANDDGEKLITNVQPVIPISLNSDWNVISRTITPIIWQDDIPTNGASSKFGIGDITQSFFFSPTATHNGLIWGAGPVLLLRTASEDALGGKKWGAGPTGILLKQSGHLTYGALVNHVWSVAGDETRSDVSSTFFQPFVNYTTSGATSYVLNTETSYDWQNHKLSVPIIAGVSQLVSVGGQKMSLGGNLRYWAASPESGPEGLGARLQLTFLFPE